ncbi:WD40 repeat-like protein [Rhizoclosmatium globosum]|uniref:Dynein axonemal intermediate chain 4 n=1 Tax=Rhizoclosmatium globosum TaxID=329046 RepID=A0A1Y2ATY9_9FUNG|nr:WD40 repeat-like protein [Rhizoclosmatium globosum]|eukprot:ORY26011.1 WD40 repeat-like protein [Rhizoclosmatium globosum]
MDQSTTGLPNEETPAEDAQAANSNHFEAPSIRSKNALQSHTNTNSTAAAMMQSQRLPKQAFRFDSSNHVADILRLPNSSMAASHSTAVVSGTKSMAGVALAQSQPSNVTVLDEEGNDVTPVSLLATKGGHFKHPMMQGMDMMSAVKESVSDVLNELESMNMASWNSSNFGGRHSASANSRASDISESDDKDDSASVSSSNESLHGVNQDGKAEAVKGSSDSVDKRVNKIDPQDSHKILHIRLKETENIILLNLPSLAVCPDFLEEVAKVKEANSNYTELCATKANNENFTDRGMQTINAPKKNKDVQASGPSFASSECQASQWDIYDAYNTNSGSVRPEEHESHIGTEDSSAQGSTSATTIANQRALSQMLAAGSGSIAAIRSNYASTQIAQSMSMDGSESERYSTTGPGGMVGEGGESQTDSSEKDAALLATLDQDSLKHSLLIMERAVVGNNYETNSSCIETSKSLKTCLHLHDPRPKIPEKKAKMKTMKVKNIEDDEDEEESYGAHIPTLNALWSYRCEVTRGRSVMYLAWNKENEDILAVASSKHFSGRNVSIDRLNQLHLLTSQSSLQTFLPLVSDGRIAIYDVRQKTDAAALDNSHIAGKHRDPVWELKWIEREHGMGDDQPRLSLWSRFLPMVGYILGTEDGHIHRCSVSYNEQYLQTQFGHTGPVYKVKWSPFLPNVFLSCSADWTVRLWDSEEESCAFKFQSGKDGITDIAWSPTNATMFSCVSNDGRLEVWDLKHSVLDPIVIHTVLDRQLTSLIFGSKSSCILIGDDSGSVTVFNLKKPASSSKRHEVPDVALTPEEQAAQLDSVLKNRNQMAKPSE